MSEPSLVAQGLELMVFGMGVVFVFLTMLVFVTGFMSKLVNKLHLFRKQRRYPCVLQPLREQTRNC